MIADPPFDDGAVKETDEVALPATAVTAVGTEGAVVTAIVLVETVATVEEPTAFCA